VGARAVTERARALNAPARAASDRARALRREAAGPLGRRHPALIALAVATLVFLVAPLAVVIPISFSAAKYLTFPPPGWSLQWYERYFGSREWMSATGRSFEVAVLTTLAATAVGTAAALALRRPFRGRSLIRLIVLAPLVVPVIIMAIAIYGLYAQLKMVGTLHGLVLAHTVLALPFVVVIVSATLQGLDETLELAAQNLGANRWQTFRLVTLPLIRPGVVSAALLAFITSFDEVVVAIFVSGTGAATLPKQMWDGIRTEIDPTVAAVSTLLIGVTTLALGLLAVVRRRASEGS
jgi:putative spermidine/putrescine transport system permease protein